MNNERGCNIRIDDSICIFICGDIEDRILRDSVDTALDVKAKKAYDYQATEEE